MKINILLVGLVLVFARCQSPQPPTQVTSPDGDIQVNFELQEGKPLYSVNFKGEKLILPSALGFTFKNIEPLDGNFEIAQSDTSSFDETWEQPWGETQFVRNHYNELKVSLVEKSGEQRKMNIIFKVFDDGVGFRYEVPAIADVDSVFIMDEKTEFALANDYKAWWIPAYRDNRYEYLYSQSAVSELDTVHTPLTLEGENLPVIAINEADLTKYASMTLANTGNNVLKCDLVPWTDGTKVKLSNEFVTPWRTIQIGDDAAGLLTSTLVLNLNDPNEMGTPDWIKPVKYIGIWWAMHIGKYTFWESENHGASTENAKKYIDFAAKHGIDHLLIEGWNTGWTPAWYENRMHVFSFTESTPDFDIEEVASYAKEHGVNMIGYHETGSNLINYLRQIDDGMKLYQDLGYTSIKIGQVGSRLNMKEWHHGQFGVNYYNFVLDKAAQYKMTVNFHEPIKQTGLQRTYPHWLAAEGARGQEYNAWSEGNPPQHLVILPFTRQLGGPMDFTPGIFSIKPTRVHTTLAKQLAIYVTMYSPLQMLADLPENYEGHPAFQFLLDVPVEWETMKVLNAKIGDYVSIARKDKNSDDWYLGTMTDESAREFEFELSFLEEGKTYEAQIYKDGPDAEYDVNPESYEIEKMEATSTTVLPLKLAKGGGAAIRFKAL